MIKMTIFVGFEVVDDLVVLGRQEVVLRQHLVQLLRCSFPAQQVWIKLDLLKIKFT